MKINSIYNMDCLEGMDRMIKQEIRVDAIITDPPYQISRDNNFHTMGREGIDFGEWDKEFDQFTWIKKGFQLLNWLFIHF